MAAKTAIGMAMPIAAASIVSVGLFAWMWRGYQHEKSGAKPPWYLEIALFVVPVVYGCLLYWISDKVPAGYFHIFSVAMAAQMFAAMFLFALSGAVWAGRGKPFRDRIIPAAAAVVFAVLILSGAFTG